MTYYLEGDNVDKEFEDIKSLEEFIKHGHAMAGGWQWIDRIYDDEGHEYGCDWDVEIEKI